MKSESVSMDKNQSPIIIGGNGGSGTRVVAEILLRSGVFLGHDLNRSNDNLLFTYLFKHPKDFAENFHAHSCPKCQSLLKLHEKLLFSHIPNTINEWILFLNAGFKHSQNRYDWNWVRQRWFNLIKSKPEINNNSFFWGWKEPQSIFFLNDIKKFYPNSKFILVVRNGLDMVYNKNTQQMDYWAKSFQINPKDSSLKNKFEFWYRSNQQTINLASRLFSSNFLVVKLETLCFHKVRIIKEIFDFIGLKTDSKNFEEICQIPKLPNSYQRYLQFDTNWIDSKVRYKLAQIDY